MSQNYLNSQIISNSLTQCLQWITLHRTSHLVKVSLPNIWILLTLFQLFPCQAYCYRGACRTRDKQCQKLWGPTGQDAHPLLNISKLDVIKCPNCHGHGVCNSIGQCHCELGYDPPLCINSGPGGSVHSGPANDSKSKCFSRVKFKCTFILCYYKN